MADNNEIWVKISGFGDKYEVSNKGRLKIHNYNKTGREIIKDTFNISKGYYRFTSTYLGKAISFFIHDAVASAFPDICGKTFEGCHVHHKDENPLNNNADNLIVLSSAEHNALHKTGKTHKGRTVSDEQKEEMVACLKPFWGNRKGKGTAVIGTDIYSGEEKYFKTMTQAATYFSVSTTAISNCVNQKQYTHTIKDHTWRLA